MNTSWFTRPILSFFSKYLSRVFYSLQVLFTRRTIENIHKEPLGAECLAGGVRRLRQEGKGGTFYGWSPTKLLGLIAILILVATGYLEFTTSRGQSTLFHWASSQLFYELKPGSSSPVPISISGPFDRQRGYSRLPEMILNLEKAGFVVHTQAQGSPWLQTFVKVGLPVIYSEKDQAGLEILDQHGKPLYATQVPLRIFLDFQSIPNVLVQTLLFIENRDLLDPCCPYANPAVEWDRLAYAIWQRGIQTLDPDYHVAGGSTLATQMEKFRHFPEGRTRTALDKFRQMTAASLRGYLQGDNTLTARKTIVLNYLNSFPLGSSPEFGDISGLGDGLAAWYGLELDKVTKNLENLEGKHGQAFARGAITYKKVLSLLLALRRPTYYWRDVQALNQLTDRYLTALSNAGIISERIREAALGYPLTLRHSPHPNTDKAFVDQKAANAIRVQLQRLLRVEGLYDLDRLDLTVHTTLDQDLQDRISHFLKKLHDPHFLSTTTLKAPHLLGQEDPADVVYSLSLWERTSEGNLLRVQTDTLNQPLDINSGTKMDLGSTAKLRTLINYLEVIEQLHESYSSWSADQLDAVNTEMLDPLSRWAMTYLRSIPDRSLGLMLNAALERKYTASPQEAFLTGGGIHRFSNFNPKDDLAVLTVRKAFQQSVNLVFIRLMRDIVQYYMTEGPGLTRSVLQDLQHPARHQYLVKFAKHEGRIFLRTFYQKYYGMEADQAFAFLLQEIRLTPKRLAVLIRTIQPEADLEEFTRMMNTFLPRQDLSLKTLHHLYKTFAPGKFNLADRGYVARLHPLELWTLWYLRSHPSAGLSEIFQAADSELEKVYAWLFQTSRYSAQDKRIRFMLEQEAFLKIHHAWQRLGYPFGALVPSYATAIGNSADRPAALAELMGIVINDGRKVPAIRISRLHFAENTPFETLVLAKPAPPEQVLNPEIARLVRKELLAVVTQGTARRALHSFKNQDGASIFVSGKTGTGDHRFKVFGQGFHLLESRVVSRTAIFIYTIGNRFYGTVAAQVTGPEAKNHQFTSSLPVEVFRLLAPELASKGIVRALAPTTSEYD